MAPLAPTGIYRAVVRAIDGNVAKVEVRNYTGPAVLPARIIVSPGLPDAALGADSIAVGDDSLALRPLQVDDEVAVTFVQGRRDELILLGRLA